LLSWHYSAQDYVLEFTDQLGNPKWSPVLNSPVLIGEQNTVSVNYGTSSRFYRLRNVYFQ